MNSVSPTLFPHLVLFAKQVSLPSTREIFLVFRKFEIILQWVQLVGAFVILICGVSFAVECGSGTSGGATKAVSSWLLVSCRQG